ncbi:MAG: RluA family pseudouridine synthase [Myxococcales bacterium]|nr:RluA family pseudouridine synthase [Myxococcales bacterium]
MEAVLPSDEGVRTEQPAALRPLIEGRFIEQRFVVEGECDGWRLDRFLQKKIRRLSRNRIQRVIRGDCEVNGRKAKPAMLVFAGQEVRFRRPALAEPEVPRGIRVLYEDEHLYALDKPAGLPIHPTARYHHSTLTAVLRERFPGQQLHVAHRLDRETSGLLLVARSAAAAAALKGAFARRRVEKRYLAIVHGVVESPQLLLDHPIGPAQGRVRVRMAVRDDGLPARTEVRTLRRLSAYTLVECRPLTGRQHQIRVHLAAIGHPVVGDKLYPDEEIFIAWANGGDEAIAGRLPLARHALHAAGLRFPHPASGEMMELDCPLPPDLVDFLACAT